MIALVSYYVSCSHMHSHVSLQTCAAAGPQRRPVFDPHTPLSLVIQGAQGSLWGLELDSVHELPLLLQAALIDLCLPFFFFDEIHVLKAYTLKVE